MVFYLLVLVGCDCGELGLWEGETVHSFGRQRLDLRQVHPRVVLDDVNPWFVFVHGLQDDLDQRHGGVNRESEASVKQSVLSYKSC